MNWIERERVFLHSSEWPQFISVICSDVFCVASSLVNFVQIGGPEGQVISEQLHDRSGVGVHILFHVIEISNSVVEGLLCLVACDIGWGQDFVIKDWVIQSQAQSNGVSWLEIRCLKISLLICVLCWLNVLLASMKLTRLVKLALWSLELT